MVTEDERKEAVFTLMKTPLGHADCRLKAGHHRWKARHPDFIWASIPAKYL